MSRDKIKNLQDQIWATRVSRINAETRLIKKESFFQGINIYYSCFTIIVSIFSLINKDDKLSLLTLLMTISLLIAILYLNGQKFLNNAKEYKKNYTELHKLQLQLEHVSDGDVQSIEEIEDSYCKLLNNSENHISYDYYCTVYQSNDYYKIGRWKNIRFKYYWGSVWRFMIKFMIIILPFLLLVVSEVA
ncbi:SLATT domain-containing protein [Faecalicoccus pleomorphus]|uniref:SLATT domain-containing protein n=1 Tax=Faecalicoccus pleomorphus TaxID=1323 RepID=UPI00189902D2|nr:SLATT domain-containing protein [Faecalicoccus pleomorphus]MDB7985138.1 SLATT domain-containing protein [Faecalicoccus pleomorphus]